MASLLSKDVKLVADLVLGITLNFLELFTAGVNQRGGHRSGDSHLTVRFVGTSRGGVGLTGAEKEAGRRSCREFHKHEKLAAGCLNTLNLKSISELSHKIENLALDLILKVGDCPDDIAEVVGWAEGAVHEAVTI